MSRNVTSGIASFDLSLRFDWLMLPSPLRFSFRLAQALVDRSWRSKARPDVVRNVFPELGDEFFWNENHVTRHHVGIFVDVLSVQDIVQLQFLHFRPSARDATVEKNLRFCSRSKSSSYTYRFGH